MTTVNSNQKNQNQPLQTHKKQDFLVIEDVNKIYNTSEGIYSVLDNINLKVSEGEFICFIGHSGCGKSTLLNMVSGFNKPTSGVVWLQGQPIKEPGPDRMMVFQNYC
ncbi:MAG: hypothetical protein RLZZ86_3785, partial [Cyanobacteriota bacterium]